MLACRRPATGIAPKDLERVVGRLPVRGIQAGSVLHWDDLAPL
jgi:N-acetylneuraminate synthase/N,N'-diacetyllegionaminate synthase